MSGTDLEDKIITSAEAKTFLRMVTKGFYNQSYTGLWIFEVIGREWDELRAWAEGLKDEINPQTCTWSIGIWEWVYGIEPDDSLSLEYRRRRIFSRIWTLRPINPETIRRGVAGVIGESVEDVTVTDFVAPYTFEVFMRTHNNAVSDRAIMHYLNEVKPSHLAVRVREETVRQFRTELLFSFGGAIATEQRHVPVAPKREFTQETDFSFGAFDYTHTRSQPVTQDREYREETDFSFGAAYGQEIRAQPVGKDRTEETEILLSHGAYTVTHGKGEPTGKDRKAETQLRMGAGAAAGAERKAEPDMPEQTVKQRTHGAGSAYGRTHIKSKLIKEEKQDG